MVVYEVVGLSQYMGWTSPVQQHRLGLYKKRSKAKKKIAKLKSDKEWKTNWQYFTILKVKSKKITQQMLISDNVPGAFGRHFFGL